MATTNSPPTHHQLSPIPPTDHKQIEAEQMVDSDNQHSPTTSNDGQQLPTHQPSTNDHQLSPTTQNLKHPQPLLKVHG
ncbi:hypothetical protein [Nostoc sp. MS1]|uniref:hypothetical protein n=1 Tax=Nostoc sp. MS1 TaxID=2764711 RepID=UPI001CC800DA|nr:hypothetical protein [Nostoc sp. MS1]